MKYNRLITTLSFPAGSFGSDAMITGKAVALWPVVFLLLMTACARVEYQAQPLDPAITQTAIQARDLDDRAFREYLQALTDKAQPGPAESWDLHRLTLAAFYHNPELQVARQQLTLSRARVKTASQRINPRLNMPLEYHSDTAGGRSPWLFGLLLDLVYERQAKRAARVEQARAGLEATKQHIREVAWDIRTRLHAAYLDYYSALQSRRLGEARHELLQQKLTVLEQRHEHGQVGAATVTAAEIERRRAGLTLANREAEAEAKYHGLIGLTGLQVDDFERIEFDFRNFEDISPLMAMATSDLRRNALQGRADIRKSLAEYQALEQALRLEIEKQYPDVTLSPGFVFDQDDKIWALGSAWMLPLYHNNDGPIAEAMAERGIMQSRFLELQGGILNRLDAALARFESLKKNLALARSIRDKAGERNNAVRNRFAAGYSDRLEAINAELDLIDSRHSLLASRVQFLEAAIDLEALAQTPVQSSVDIGQSLEMLDNLNASFEGDI